MGTLYWSGESQSVDINKDSKHVVVQGIDLEVKLERSGLRLSKLEVVDDKFSQFHEHLSNFENELQHRRIELEAYTTVCSLLQVQMASADDDEQVGLFEEFREKNAIRKNHEKAIREFDEMKTLHVKYEVRKHGLTTVLPPGLNLQPKFLLKPVCWCPYDHPKSNVVDERELKLEDISLSTDSAAPSGGVASEVLAEQASYVLETIEEGMAVESDSGVAAVAEATHGVLEVFANKNGGHEPTQPITWKTYLEFPLEAGTNVDVRTQNGLWTRAQVKSSYATLVQLKTDDNKDIWQHLNTSEHKASFAPLDTFSKARCSAEDKRQEERYRLGSHLYVWATPPLKTLGQWYSGQVTATLGFQAPNGPGVKKLDESKEAGMESYLSSTSKHHAIPKQALGPHVLVTFEQNYLTRHRWYHIKGPDIISMIKDS